MFTDEAKITITAGKGGDGAVHFRRMKYQPRGGPDGGDGGKGGDIIFEVVANVHTLADYRTRKNFTAENGQPGGPNDRAGRHGKDLILPVPPGTQVRDAHTHTPIVDLVRVGQKAILVRGGVGGKGNAGFVSSIRQAPHFAEKGDRGETLDLELELKMVADMAVIGYPSVGKSTFISVVSNARPKIADYPFTTLVPNLGVATIDDRELVVVDVPGLIEGAAEGKGLGHRFLRHIERAYAVLHLVDALSEDAVEEFQTVRAELTKFSPKLAEKPFLLAISKADTLQEEERKVLQEALKKAAGQDVYILSSATGEGVKELLRAAERMIPQDYHFADAEHETEPAETDTPDTEEYTDDGRTVFRPSPQGESRKIRVSRSRKGWIIENERLQRMVRQTDMGNPEAVQRVYDVLHKWGIMHKLTNYGAEDGDILIIEGEKWELRLRDSR